MDPNGKFNTKVSPSFDILMGNSDAQKRNKMVRSYEMPVNPRHRASVSHYIQDEKMQMKQVHTQFEEDTEKELSNFIKLFPPPTEQYNLTLKIKFETKFG